jgi:hypothetical protein
MSVEKSTPLPSHNSRAQNDLANSSTPHVTRANNEVPTVSTCNDPKIKLSRCKADGRSSRLLSITESPSSSNIEDSRVPSWLHLRDLSKFDLPQDPHPARLFALQPHQPCLGAAPNPPGLIYVLATENNALCLRYRTPRHGITADKFYSAKGFEKFLRACVRVSSRCCGA